MATYSDYNKQITDLLAQQPAQNQAYQAGLESQYGLAPRQADLESIRRSAMETDKLLADLPTQLKQRTQGMLMTQGQMGRQQAVESAPLAQTLANLNRNESVAQTGISSIQNMINDALARRQQEQNAYLSELQNQRNMAFQAEEAGRARTAASSGNRARTAASSGNDWSFLDDLLKQPTETTQPIDSGNYIDPDMMTAAQLGEFLNTNANVLNPGLVATLRNEYNVKLNNERQQAAAKQAINTNQSKAIQPKAVMPIPAPLITNIKKAVMPIPAPLITNIKKPIITSTPAISSALSSYLSPKSKPLVLKK